MILLRKATKEQLSVFDRLDKQTHAYRFVFQTGLQQHEKNFSDPDITYLTIVDEDEDLKGYFILAREQATNSIEFRRIIVDQAKLGIGQRAIRLMEDYCRDYFTATRLWLDVFEDNARGIHIYQKLGYRFFKERQYDNRRLLFFEKKLEQ